MSKLGTTTLSRRELLQTTVKVGVGTGLVGQASAEGTEETTRRIVGTETKAAAAQIKRRAARVLWASNFGKRGYVVVGEFPDTDVALASQSRVRYVESASEVSVLGREVSQAGSGPTVESQRTPWGIKRTGADAMHDRGRRGDGAHVAIIDTGIDSDHPDLKANLGRGYASVACDEGCRRQWDDDHDHGTHVAGIAGAIANTRGVVGVAPKVTLHAVKAISADGRGDTASLAEGIKWASDQGYDVINMSLGTTAPSDVMRDAVRYAKERGVVIVAAAGNEEPDEDTVHYPAKFSEVIAVGATNDDDELAEFSLTGDAVEMVAPGVRIPSTTIGDYKYFSGTSMATPHVTGAAAALAARGHSRSAIRDKLTASADDLGLDNDEQGNGLLDCDGAARGGDDRGGDDSGDDLAVTTRGATEVTKTEATLNGKLDSLGDTDAATVGFEYWVAGEKASTQQTARSGELSSPGEFSASLEDLQTGTTYVYTARAVAGDTETTGRQTDFTTEATPSDVMAIETREPRDIEEDEAELVGEVTKINGVAEVEVSFEFWPKGNESARRTTDIDEIDELESFDEDAEELQSGTTYVAVARGVADGFEVRGEQREFTTGGRADDGGPASATVESREVRDIDDDEAELVGEITELSGVEEVVVGFEFWPKDDESARRTTDTDEVDELEAFDEDAEDLDSETTYVAAPFVISGDQQKSGSTMEFTTAQDD
jgi:subtilisin